jgi:hypothetical protein
VGFLDLEGNVRLGFDAVFIERAVASKPAVERRELKSLFKPKSAQVLTVMLRDPAHTWRVTELAEAADVSLGHVSNVRSGLLDHEWGRASPQGLFLADPDRLLDAWRDAYEPPAGQRLGFYTTLHGGAFEEAARRVLRAGSDKGRAIFASFSAAHWLAPFARTGTQFFYADEHGLERLQTALALSSPAKGENVVATVPEDEGVFRDAVEPAAGAVCSGLVRTYLDLSAAGERGQEAAEHLSTGEDGMEKVIPPEPRSASDYDTTAAVRSVLIEVGQILGAFKGKFVHPSAVHGYGFIAEKFDSVESYGPTCVRKFVEQTAILGDRSPEQWQQDAFGQVDAWLRALGLRG